MDKTKILVAVDFGPTSARAYETAIVMAARLGARLDIVHVTPPVPVEMTAAGVTAPYVENAYEELSKLQLAAEQKGVIARTHLRMETVVFGLLEAIKELNPDWVVVGSHGYQGVKRALLGSVSESLARRCHVPVVIVPSPERSQVLARAAWSCADCGHILGDGERSERCTRCGRIPARWSSAPMSSLPSEPGEPTIGEAVAPDLESVQTSGGAGGAGGGFFATAPAGGNNRTEVNPELRVRY